MLRYYSKAILASLRRERALSIWRDLRNSQAVLSGDGLTARYPSRTLERALGALDLFVINDDVGDVDHVRLLISLFHFFTFSLFPLYYMSIPCLVS